MNLKIKFLGAIEEVGRSSILIRNGEEGILLDSGVALTNQVRFPEYVSPEDFSTLLITHCHLDHVGSAPLFFISSTKRAYMTKMTKELSRILLLDMLKVAKTYLPFEALEITRFLQNSIEVKNGEEFEIKRGITVKMLNAGHVVGASQILLEIDGKTILYTGDINVNPTRTVAQADTNYKKNIDILITESTYATKEHPKREVVEKEFVEETKEVIENGGVVLVPAFGVGRAQEIISVFQANNFPYKVMLDGMARKVTEIFMENLDEINEPHLFTKATENAYILQSDKDREIATKEPGVIVTPAGMLKGGPSVRYSVEIAKNKKNAIFLVSYQVEGTPGDTLIKKKILTLGKKMVKVRAKIKQFDFSSHNGKSDYIKLIERINPKIVFPIHGSRENVSYLYNEINSMKETKAIMPNLNEVYTF